MLCCSRGGRKKWGGALACSLSLSLSRAGEEISQVQIGREAGAAPTERVSSPV